MAVLAVLIIPPLMLGLVLALGRYEELLLPQQAADQPAPAAAPVDPTPAASLAPSAPLLRPTGVLSSDPDTSDARSSRAVA
jgi:hypothetical protein